MSSDDNSGFSNSKEKRKAVAPGPGSFRMSYPKGLTAKGRDAFRASAREHSKAIAREMERQAIEDGSAQGEAEHTQESVTRAVEAMSEQKMLEGAARHASRAGRSTKLSALGPILVTAGTVGVSSTSSFLHSPWQLVLFGASALCGTLGLTITWITRPRKST